MTRLLVEAEKALHRFRGAAVMKREKVLKIGRRSNQKLLPALLVLICCFSYASLAAKAKMKVGSNMRVSENLQNGTRKLTESQKIAIENDLNEKAGLNSIRFDTNGELTYDKTEEPVNGSAKFRQAITGAIDDETNEFILVNYSGSKNVIFALMDTGTSAVTLTSTAGKFVEAKRITIYQIRIDFDDYENSEKYTPEEVLRSHTIGILVLFFRRVRFQLRHSRAELYLKPFI